MIVTALKVIVSIILLCLSFTSFAQLKKDKVNNLEAKGDAAYSALNFREAFKHYQKDADNGAVSSQLKVGNLCKDHPVPDCNGQLMKKYYRMAANKGNAEAQFWLGMIYKTGWPNMLPTDTINIEKAIRWFKKSADQGNKAAQYHLAVYYLNISKTNEDSLRAENMFKLSSEKGFVKAQTTLADYYYDQKKINEAVKWYTQAAQNCDEYALSIITTIAYSNPSLIRIDCVQMAKDCQNNSDSKFLKQLAQQFELGLLCSKDSAVAIQLYQKAANQLDK